MLGFAKAYLAISPAITQQTQSKIDGKSCGVLTTNRLITPLMFRLIKHFIGSIHHYFCVGILANTGNNTSRESTGKVL